MIVKLEHIGILAKNMDESVRFYSEILGMNLVERVWLNEQVELAFLSFPGQESVQVELVGRDPSAVAEEGIVNHLALTVDDIDAVISKLKQHGYDISDEYPRTILDGRKIAFFKGPSGEKLELFQPA
jgi:lactoylglutathione lyase